MLEYLWEVVGHEAVITGIKKKPRSVPFSFTDQSITMHGPN